MRMTVDPGWGLVSVVLLVLGAAVGVSSAVLGLIVVIGVSLLLWIIMRLHWGGNGWRDQVDRSRGLDWDGGLGGPVPVPSGPPPGLSERGPRQRGPRARAEAALWEQDGRREGA